MVRCAEKEDYTNDNSADAIFWWKVGETEESEIVMVRMI